jgi:hypothetical protein
VRLYAVTLGGAIPTDSQTMVLEVTEQGTVEVKEVRDNEIQLGRIGLGDAAGSQNDCARSLLCSSEFRYGGRIGNVIPVSGSIAFVPNVVRAVRQWRYEPTFSKGKTVETEAYILVEFNPTTGGASSP